MIEKTNWEPMCQAEIEGDPITIICPECGKETYLENWQKEVPDTITYTPTIGAWGVDWEEATDRDRGDFGYVWSQDCDCKASIDDFEGAVEEAARRMAGQS